MPEEFTDANFSQMVVNSERPVLLDAWAPWCRPCNALSPVIEKIAAEHPDVVVGKLNIDENPKTTQDLAVGAIPTVLLFKNGQVVKRFVGLQSEQTLVEAIQSL